MKIGYARVSGSGQSLEAQVAALEAEGCEEIFQEKQSGKSIENRTEFKAALSMCRKGDILIATKIDRIARSMVDLWGTITTLKEKQAALKILDQSLIDTTKAEGMVVVTLFGYVAETERQLILERTAQGRARAKDKGVKFGRKKILNDKELLLLQRESGEWKGSMTELGLKFGLSRSSVYRLLATLDAGAREVV